jgi:hypothetical protein
MTVLKGCGRFKKSRPIRASNSIDEPSGGLLKKRLQMLRPGQTDAWVPAQRTAYPDQCRYVSEELLKRLQSAGRGAKTDNGTDPGGHRRRCRGTVVCLLAWLRRVDRRQRRPDAECGIHFGSGSGAAAPRSQTNNHQSDLASYETERRATLRPAENLRKNPPQRPWPATRRCRAK